MAPENPTPDKVATLREVLAGVDSLLIVLQDHPDPDALASAAALREIGLALGVSNVLTTSGGEVGRVENRALMRYLQLPWRRSDAVEFDLYERVAMVDTQPRTGNNTLADGIDVHIVVDHHPILETTRAARLYDVRESYGATATILFEYLLEAGVEVDTVLATALVYGIRSDTHDLGRDATGADIEAITSLYPLADHGMLSEIQTSKTPRSYFGMLARAIRRAVVYDTCVVSEMGPVEIPDIVGEVADLLLRDEGCTWSMCMGTHDSQLLLSLRTADRTRDAGAVMRTVVEQLGTGGGHRAMAGGQVPLPADAPVAPHELGETLVARLLTALDIDAACVPLVAEET